jgi:hypothetical protein
MVMVIKVRNNRIKRIIESDLYSITWVVLFAIKNQILSLNVKKISFTVLFYEIRYINGNKKIQIKSTKCQYNALFSKKT